MLQTNLDTLLYLIVTYYVVSNYRFLNTGQGVAKETNAIKTFHPFSRDLHTWLGINTF
jgi:hypothetical protein